MDKYLTLDGLKIYNAKLMETIESNQDRIEVLENAIDSINSGGVVDLTNYYTKAQIDNLLQDNHSVNISKVQTLPAIGDSDTIYLTPIDNADGDNLYKEYIYVDGRYELVGTTDLTDADSYITEQEAIDLWD